MKTRSPHPDLVAAIAVAFAAIGITTIIFAAEPKQARVTQVVRDVNLLAGI